jgi:hypothetical protein
MRERITVTAVGDVFLEGGVEDTIASVYARSRLISDDLWRELLVSCGHHRATGGFRPDYGGYSCV